MGVHVFPILNPLPIPQGHPSAPALSTLSHASNLIWRSISHIIYMFQCYSLKSSHPCLLPESKSLFFTSESLLLSRIQGYCYHLSKFHIYVLVYCIGEVSQKEKHQKLILKPAIYKRTYCENS